MAFSDEKRKELIDAIMEAQNADEDDLILIEGDVDDDEEDDYEVLQQEAGEDSVILPTIALRGLTVLPGMIMHFDIGREKSVKALEEAM